MSFFTAVFHLPMLVACVTGLVLVRARARSLAPRTARLATLGLALLLASGIVSMVWEITLPWVFQSSDRSLYSVVAGVHWLISTALSVGGLGALIAAVLSRSGRAQPWEAADPGPRPPFIQ
ncbi:hypothetical protein [Catenuloplanes atrovinosus]|uniref:Uncharacterized protein n=1 Tax=Catenuloplanes atrovinosus TaxID=137266 RepID=A0AAE4CEE5_9ACTN|nr:hypothetical protein [Catenuloplanes atrovinosus]MDR7281038.1 hypothetical protein [Catenuloplanes atrovinosus]